MLDAEGDAATDDEHAGVSSPDTTSKSQPAPPQATQIVRSRRKRAFDITVASLLLLLFLPILLSAVIAIKLDSKGPVLFKQRRTGLGGKVFTIFKFRTMRVLEDAHEITQASKGDPRITPLGKLLRHTSLDEFPQLINVLRGDMSIVGPRPHAIAHDTYYGESIEDYSFRFRVRPGLTGLAQVSGSRGATPNIGDMEKRITFDNHYIDNWHIKLDFDILFRTARIFLASDQHAY